MIEARKPCLTQPWATIIVGGVSLLVTGLVALTYAPMRAEIDALRRDVTALQVDRARLDERLNNMHGFLVQIIRAEGKKRPD
jgi:hypothetical protein